MIEDEQDIRDLLVDSLVDTGYEVIDAPDGVAGLQQAFDHHPDIILLDIMMPGMDGLETLAKLKANPDTQSLPVIMVSAKGQEQDIKNAIRAGAWDYVTKPWGPGDLEIAVANAEDYLNESTMREAS